MNYNDFFALAENKGINRIQVTETYIKKNEIQFIDKNLEKYNFEKSKDLGIIPTFAYVADEVKKWLL